MTMLSAVYVLLPRKRFVFSLIGSALYERLYGLGMDEVHRRLAYDLDRFWEENDVEIGRLRHGVQLAAAGLTVEASGASKPTPPPPPPPTPGIGSPETRSG